MGRRRRRIPPLTALVVIVILVFYALQSCVPDLLTSTPQPPTPTTATTGQSGTPGLPASLGKRTKTSGCVAANGLPDAACTPGAAFADATVEKICQPGYSSEARNVPTSLKNKVYAEYGILSHEPGQYEVDHLVSLELGGSNEIANLWPEAAEPRPGFHEKDKVENYLHDQVCSGKISLQQAQIQEATNWLAIYQTLP
ncbi:MAG: HNH endonuclease [Anaerolineae bacterium]